MRGSGRNRRKPMSEINVVPYIDVMLVLLVIFMVTAPLVHQGVDVDLPQMQSDPVPPDDSEPVIVTVTRDGELRMSIGAEPDESLEPAEIRERVERIMRNSPETSVLVRGDENVRYGRVLDVMAMLQQAGAPQVGLMTRPPADD